MTRTGQAVTFFVAGVALVILALVQGYGEVQLVNGLVKTTCGSAWSPDYSEVTAAGLEKCVGMALPHGLVACTFLLAGTLSLLAMTWVATGLGGAKDAPRA